jgi:hypothetical protein
MNIVRRGKWRKEYVGRKKREKERNRILKIEELSENKETRKLFIEVNTIKAFNHVQIIANIKMEI